MSPNTFVSLYNDQKIDQLNDLANTCSGPSATARAGNSNQAQSNHVPRPKAVGSNSNSFYGHGSRKLSGACSLNSAERFDVRIGYHEAVVAAIKAIASCRKADILFLKHACSILRQSCNPV